MNVTMRVSLVAVLAIIFAAPVFAAKKLVQSYADVGYTRFSGDDYDVDGATVDATFGIFDLVSLRAAFTRGDTDSYPLDRDPSDPDLYDFRFGLRPHYSFSKKLDVYADLLFNNKKFDGNSTETETGGIYGGGVRWLILPRLELTVGGEYRGADIDAGFLMAGGTFKVNKILGINVETNQSTDDQEYFAGIRFFFK